MLRWGRRKKFVPVVEVAGRRAGPDRAAGCYQELDTPPKHCRVSCRVRVMLGATTGVFHAKRREGCALPVFPDTRNLGRVMQSPYLNLGAQSNGSLCEWRSRRIPSAEGTAGLRGKSGGWSPAAKRGVIVCDSRCEVEAGQQPPATSHRSRRHLLDNQWQTRRVRDGMISDERPAFVHIRPS